MFPYLNKDDSVRFFLPHGLVILVMDMNIGLVYTSSSKKNYELLEISVNNQKRTIVTVA